jgi:hypothetical protein
MGASNHDQSLLSNWSLEIWKVMVIFVFHDSGLCEKHECRFYVLRLIETINSLEQNIF